MIATIPRSSLPDIAWPAIVTDDAARLLALQVQFRRSERWPADRMRAHQFAQLRQLLTHADRTMPFWRTRLRAAGIAPDTALTPDAWARIPILARSEAQDAGDALYCLSIPPAHGERQTASTSGSTGRPLRVARTDIQQIFWHAFLLRDMLWHRIDFSAKNATLRTMRNAGPGSEEGISADSLGGHLDSLFFTGPACAFNILRPTAEQAAWLLREDPAYLLTFSSNLSLLAQQFRDTAERPKNLRALRGFAEVVTDDARNLCREVFGVEIIDAYTAEEAGYLALQCPDNIAAMHVMSESVYLEVLNAAGEPCAPGEVGRVVITPLHNFAMPLIRYEIGDLAECGAPCTCGRNLPVLSRILGRTRDAVIMPDGSTRAAFVGSKGFYKVPAIRQFQVAQTARDTIEVRLVVRVPLTAEEEAFITGLVRADLDARFRVNIVYVDTIPRASSGKSQEFKCEIA